MTYPAFASGSKPPKQKLPELPAGAGVTLAGMAFAWTASGTASASFVHRWPLVRAALSAIVRILAGLEMPFDRKVDERRQLFRLPEIRQRHARLASVVQRRNP